MKTPVESAIGNVKRNASAPRFGLHFSRCASRWSVVLAACFVGAACGSRLDQAHGTDTGNPPVIDSARITMRIEGTKVVVQGESGAVPPGSTIRAENAELDVSTKTIAATDGSFEVSIEGEPGTDIRLSVEAFGETSELSLEVPERASSSVPPNATSVPVGGEQPSVVPPSAPHGDAGGVQRPPPDVDWPNVDWQSSMSIEFSQSLSTPLGLWMGTGLNGALPAEPAEDPPYALEGDDQALRLVGGGIAQGADIYLHTPLPVERAFAGVYLNARSRIPGGQTVRVTLGGPSEHYWSDVNAGARWPTWQLELGREWSKHELTFAELGFDADNLSPYSDPWGALHFLVSPEQAYDFEIFDLILVNFSAR